ncbi:dihydropteroate synthase [Gammaproteobacteria bacterium]|nr:dihydropteroate synthase [Gammaproteobacteria bacterium]
MTAWHCGDYRLDVTKTVVVGILNATPDSFYAESRCKTVNDTMKKAEKMVLEGVDMIDVGGESTRPFAKQVAESEESDRVIPHAAALARAFSVPISLDTSEPLVMQKGLDVGVSVINDVRALTRPGAVEVVAKAQCGVCLVHMNGEPQNMQIDPKYPQAGGVVAAVKKFLTDRVKVCEGSDIDKQRLAVDLGFGFGKNVDHQITLFKHIQEFKSLSLPIYLGLSRKSFWGHITTFNQDRLTPTIVGTMIAVMRGARIIRTHDVGATKTALEILDTLGPSLCPM